MLQDAQMCVQGGCAEILPDLPPNSVDACVTDPPYGIRFMGSRWDYDVPKAVLWARVLRVLKPGAHLLSFFSTKTYHRGAAAIEDAGFEIRDMIGWVYGTGFPHSRNLPDGQGTGMKPSVEPIVLARKPLKGSVEDNVAEWGTGALNIDQCRIPYQSQMDLGQGADRPRQRVNDLGRWPANLVHDGSDEVVKLFPKGADRYFYCAKASREEREAGLEGLPLVTGAEAVKRAPGSAGLTPAAGAGRSAEAVRNTHPTVKPLDLMAWLVRLVAGPGCVVLDPFAGSGSTGVACARLQVHFVGIELEAKYVEMANLRIQHELSRNPGDW